MACKNGVCNVNASTQNPYNAQVQQIPQPPKGNFFTGSPGGFAQLPSFTPEQQTALSELLQSGITGLRNRAQQAPFKFDFAPIESQARANFSTETIPSIAEKFTSMGSGAPRSSAFQGALGGAASNLERDLAALKSQYGLQQEEIGLRRQGLEDNNLMNLLQFGLAPRNENLYFPSQPGALQGLASGGGGVVSSLLGLLIKKLGGF